MPLGLSLLATLPGTLAILELPVLHLGHVLPQFEDLLLGDAFDVDYEAADENCI